MLNYTIDLVPTIPVPVPIRYFYLSVYQASPHFIQVLLGPTHFCQYCLPDMGSQEVQFSVAYRISCLECPSVGYHLFLCVH